MVASNTILLKFYKASSKLHIALCTGLWYENPGYVLAKNIW